ncbi:hypothetical protein DFH09DRAFT_1288112 [Mycena vulgaris]|nr:hypothetical protein DFH09DRAFT_1288112 [Mycena vulgaris]
MGVLFWDFRPAPTAFLLLDLVKVGRYSTPVVIDDGERGVLHGIELVLDGITRTVKCGHPQKLEHWGPIAAGERREDVGERAKQRLGPVYRTEHNLAHEAKVHETVKADSVTRESGARGLIRARWLGSGKLPWGLGRRRRSPQARPLHSSKKPSSARKEIEIDNKQETWLQIQSRDRERSKIEEMIYLRDPPLKLFHPVCFHDAQHMPGSVVRVDMGQPSARPPARAPKRVPPSATLLDPSTSHLLLFKSCTSGSFHSTHSTSVSKNDARGVECATPRTLSVRMRCAEPVILKLNDSDGSRRALLLLPAVSSLSSGKFKISRDALIAFKKKLRT